MQSPILEMPGVEMAFDNRFDGLDKRVGDAEKDLKQLGLKLQPLSARIGALEKRPTTSKGWLKRNSHWLWPTIGYLFGTGCLATFFGLLMDRQIDSKLKEPVRDVRQLHR